MFNIHWINHYPLDGAVCFVNTYPLDSDLSGGCVHELSILGTVHFLCDRGGLVGLRGGHEKKTGLKGGPSKKILSVRGGHSKHYRKIL